MARPAEPRPLEAPRPPEPAADGGLRAIALFEAGKGALVVLAGLGLLALAHRDLHAWGERLLAHLHLNPARGAPLVFLEALARLHDARLLTLAAGAAAYAAMRFLEAWGLWRRRRWARWLGAASGAAYVPFELAHLVRHGPQPLALAAFTLNLAIVAYLLRGLARAPGAR